ncbi:E3 ubiquitin-protein ligase rnf146 [Octopus bimaculoides]|uniref:E3 ubiquitin-protein ligase n=1 Tax=Octopus bimaculoides TaxID=37653 RepID=A0A0L8GZ36_OCTBM|nr:E3 ubiquitin-protein ligase rnf146 [Octopus bimaculoides]|eukprot:XP_014776784.1 PREDICTED: E3 ubiquitin-protein ligase rnf146-like [Octopus bimaculoides]
MDDVNLNPCLQNQNWDGGNEKRANIDVVVEDHQDEEMLPINTPEKFECAICLHPCEYPVQLPCKHIFCFLCMKGSAKQSQRCALCRQEIPDSCFLNPPLLNEEQLEKTVTFDKNYQWFYEGRNGWWQYDERTSREMEQRYKTNETSFDLLIAGYVYTIDFEKNIQYRQDNPMKRRQIKRDFVNIPEKKGIAGIKLNQSSQGRPGPLGGEIPSMVSRLDSNACDDSVMSPPAPNNTPQSPANSPLHSTFSSEQDLSLHLENLQLTESHST